MHIFRVRVGSRMFVRSVVLFSVSSCTVLLSPGVVDLNEKNGRRRGIACYSTPCGSTENATCTLCYKLIILGLVVPAFLKKKRAFSYF